MSLLGKIRAIPAWAWCATVAWTALSAAGGGLLTDFSDFRKSQIEASSKAVDSAIEANEALTPLLVKFAKVALNEGTVTAEDRVELDQTLNKANEKALTVKSVYPSLSGSYDAYADALIEIKQSADQLKGPLSAKPFVKAVANYSVARDNFRVAAENMKSSYLNTFVSR